MRKKLIHLFMSVFIILCFGGCQGLFFYPLKPVLYNPETCAAGPENFFIKTEDNKRLHAWLFRTKEKHIKGTIVFFHGNANNISTESVGVLWLLQEGYNIFTFDYRGYGISEGKPSIKGVLNDGVDAIDAMMEVKDLDRNNLILYGQSLGGAVASYAAANSKFADKFKVLILDSTFTSWRDMAKEAANKFFLTWMFQYPISWSFPKGIGSIDLISKSKIKNTLIAYSRADRLIKYTNGVRLYHVANNPKYFIDVDNAAHAQIFSIPENRKLLVNYLNKVLDNKTK